MSIVVTSVICTVAVASLLALAFWAGVKFEQKRRRRFNEWIEQTVDDATLKVVEAVEQFGNLAVRVH